MRWRWPETQRSVSVTCNADLEFTVSHFTVRTKPLSDRLMLPKHVAVKKNSILA